MRISVVVIVYNLEAYIDEAIDSVLNQTRPADEIIVVDDCSTDASAALVKGFGGRVRYLRTANNSGALLAALEGVKATVGDVVCMLDGDDFWAADKLAVVEREFAADPKLILLSHDHVRVDETGAELNIRDETHRNIAALRRRAGSPEELSNLLKQTILDQKGYWLGSAYAFRRRSFDQAMFEGQIARFGFDWLKQAYLDLVVAPFLVLTNPSGRIGYTPDTRFFYRVHAQGSLAGNKTPERARQSAKKGRAINELIYAVLHANGAGPAHLRRRERLLLHYDFLIALYSGQRATAARYFARLARTHWTWDQLRKESLRFAAVLLLGPRRFLALKNKGR
jgi:glycosyltransferase involved in cell wall biosynthesis